MTDAEGPGTHVLLQTFTVPAVVPGAFLAFDIFIGNRTDAFRTPNSLDFSTPTLNQQARVDILTASATAFSLAVSDVLLNAYRTNAGDPLVSGYNHVIVNISSVVNANIGTPLQLRFAEVDNVGPFQLGVDNVDIIVQAATIPEPSTWMTAAAAFAALGALLRRRKAA
jgi:hypothetical protein